jgi:hypothetical protein
MDFSDPSLPARLDATGPGFSVDAQGILVDLADGWEGLDMHGLLPEVGTGDIRLVLEITPLQGSGEVADLTISTGMDGRVRTLDRHWTGHEFKLGGPGYANQELKLGGQPIARTSDTDRILETGRTSRVELVRSGGRLHMSIDGDLVLAAPTVSTTPGTGIGIMGHRIRARIGLISLQRPAVAAVN